MKGSRHAAGPLIISKSPRNLFLFPTTCPRSIELTYVYLPAPKVKMDPLSVTASVITLIEASGILTKSLHGFIHGLKTVDARVTKLCEELKNLTDLLEAVERTLKECRSFDLAHVEEDLWQQSNIALADCQATLNDLKMLIAKVKKAAGSRPFGWKLRAMFDLTLHGNEVVAFQEKIHKSNGALQTILHTITVSLTLKSNASQTLIMDELSRLRLSIDRALEISARPSGVFTHTLGHQSDARLSRNLQALAKAAKHFHSTASSTAGTSRGDRSDKTWQPTSSAAISLSGNFPSFKRERVERFINEGQPRPSPSVPEVDSLARSKLPAISPASLPVACPAASPTAESCTSPVKSDPPDSEHGSDHDYIGADDDDDYEAAFNRDYIVCIRQFAIDNLKARDFTKAGELLKEALAHCAKATPESEDSCLSSYISMRSLNIQLAICYFFQGNWKMAEPVVTDLAASKSGRDSVVCNLLHALALAYLSEYSFDIAVDTCKRALKGYERLSKRSQTDISTLDLNNSLGLLATTYDMTGDYLRAAVFRRRLSQGFKYQHPSSVVEYFDHHSELLTAVLGPCTLDPAFVVLPESPMGQLNEQESGICFTWGHDMPQPRWDSHGNISHLSSDLRLSMMNHRRLEVDTSKELVAQTIAHPTDIEDDTADESSPTDTVATTSTAAESAATTPDASPVQDRPTRVLSNNGLSRPIPIEESDSTTDPVTLPCHSCQHVTRNSQASTSTGQKVSGAIRPKLSIKLPTAKNADKWAWVRSRRTPSAEEPPRPSKLQRRFATRVSPVKSSGVGEWLAAVKWFRGGHSESSSPVDPTKAVPATHKSVTHKLSGPEGRYHELNDNAVSELENTCLPPELHGCDFKLHETHRCSSLPGPATDIPSQPPLGPAYYSDLPSRSPVAVESFLNQRLEVNTFQEILEDKVLIMPPGHALFINKIHGHGRRDQRDLKTPESSLQADEQSLPREHPKIDHPHLHTGTMDPPRLVGFEEYYDTQHLIYGNHEMSACVLARPNNATRASIGPHDTARDVQPVSHSPPDGPWKLEISHINRGGYSTEEASGSQVASDLAGFPQLSSFPDDSEPRDKVGSWLKAQSSIPSGSQIVDEF
ncbi:uncharacterized protein CCOS01_00269 [Colletotrichum costaricense]|uniref:Azaphilone pigments biosynthesis cluster protein L N-terminal domain-containing protein n=1 Tax=Colletotrichum costaricense TaxID=1209916 RepID=A0AAI9Z8R3_9PEZI|nr:uncharacterized protein CCOS01_00269 [Colletotrichum costaricense]KAK1538955.1 hypothetical protein CCOS01_00269 [Colletotrichum costaricense]